MSRTFPAALATVLRSEKIQPVWLCHISTGGSPADLRFSAYDGDISFASQTWSRRPFDAPEISAEDHNDAPTRELRIADADGYFQTLLAGGITFGSRRVRLYLTDLTLVGTGSALTDAIVSHFIIEGFTRVHGWAVLRLRSLLSVFEIDLPLTTVTHSEFPGLVDSGAA